MKATAVASPWPVSQPFRCLRRSLQSFCLPATRDKERTVLFFMRVLQSIMLMSSSYSLAFAQVVTIVASILILGVVTPVEVRYICSDYTSRWYVNAIVSFYKFIALIAILWMVFGKKKQCLCSLFLGVYAHSCFEYDESGHGYHAERPPRPRRRHCSVQKNEGKRQNQH